MSTPPSAQPPPSPNKPRKKRSADVVSFEDLLAAHKTERGPGQLPAEGVVLIGVDLELQRRMAEGITFPGAPKLTAPNNPAPELPAPENAAPQVVEEAPMAAINIGAPEFAPPKLGALDIEPSISAYNNDAPKFSAPEPNALESHEMEFGAPDFDLSDLLVR